MAKSKLTKREVKAIVVRLAHTVETLEREVESLEQLMVEERAHLDDMKPDMGLMLSCIECRNYFKDLLSDWEDMYNA